MEIYTIYKATNTNNNKSYIGFDSNWPLRIKDHRNNALVKNMNTIFYKAIRKHGWDKFSWEIVYQSLDKEHCFKTMENYFITEFRTYIKFEGTAGYNMTLGGDGTIGHTPRPTPESNLKRSNTLKGRVITTEHRSKIGAARKGLKFSKEWCNNISKARLEKTDFKPLSDEHKSKISNSNKRPKYRCTCINCKRELSVNSLNGNHRCT